MVDFLFNRKVSPVVITTPSSKEATVQQIYDAVKNWSDEPINLVQRSIISGAGKEDLGGGTKVGLTITLLNAQQSFGQRVTSESEGSVTTGDTNGEQLIDSAATFESDGVSPGDAIINFTDRSVGTVLEVISETEIEHMALEDGSDNQWEIGDTYKIWPVEQCEVSGGNLVAVDGNGDPMSPIFPTPFTQIILARSSSATQSDIEAIQFASFQNGVHIDVLHGQSGTDYPIGTREYPVNNLADAKAIAVERGFYLFHICHGDFILGAGDNVDGYTLIGECSVRTTVIVEAGCSTVKTIFETMALNGTLNGRTVLKMVAIANLAGFDGVANSCFLFGDIGLAGTEGALFHDCQDGIAGFGVPSIDMGGSGRSLTIGKYAGGVEVKNKTGADDEVSINLVAGRVILANTITAGDIIIRGVGHLINNSDGANVDSDGLIAKSTIADIAWATPTAKILLGLAGKNQRIFPVDFDTFGNMTIGYIRIYNSKDDADADENHIAQIDLTGEFEGINKPTAEGLKQVLAP